MARVAPKIPPSVNFAAATPFGGKAGRNDYGETGYGGPCPPRATARNRYIFRVYALDVDRINASEGTTGASVTFMTRGHVLATGATTAKFGR